MSPANVALGRAVAQVALESVQEQADGARHALRVAGFDQAVVQAALCEIAASLASSPSQSIVVKVGTSDPIEGVPESFLLGPGETLTYWRNERVGALLVFDWDVPRDREGLAAFSTLDGANLLAPDVEEEAGLRLRRLTRTAWEVVGGTGAPLETLHDYLARVWSALSEEGQPAVRRWMLFVIEVAEALVAAEVRTPAVVERAIAEALPGLELFPDRDLFANPNSLELRIKRNARMSTLNEQPTGATISEDDLLARIGAAAFSDEHLSRLGADQGETRALMSELVMQKSDVARRRLDYGLWLELFERETARVGLGGQVRAMLEKSAPERIGEFDSLDVEVELDQSDQGAAERLLNAETPGDSPRLADLLGKPLRRRVEKVAVPDAQVTDDPLRALLHALIIFDDEDSGTVSIRLEGTVETGTWTRWLFAFLYGGVLQDIQESACGGRLALELPTELTSTTRPAPPADGDPFDVEAAWAPLRFVVEMEGSGFRRFRWDPRNTTGQIAVAALTNGYETAPGEDSEDDFDSWFDRFTDPDTWDRQATVLDLGDVSAALRGLRLTHFKRWSNGLTVSALDHYFREWSDVIDRARTDLIPANAPNKDLAQVVLSDIVQISGNRLLMLATHPLRLRWLARHYEEMSQHLSNALASKLVLNPENSDLFFQSLDRVSPHGTPPLTVGPNETVAIPVRESAGHEEYVPVRHAGQESREWLAAVDDAAIDEMIRVIQSYIDTYPHKLDGLSVLLLDGNGDPRLPIRVAKRVRARSPRLRLNLIVLAPELAHHEIIQAFDAELATDDVADERFLPDVQLVLQSWHPDEQANLEALKDEVDVALAPALFGTRTSLNIRTRESDSPRPRNYDAWIDKSTHELDESSTNVVRELLPGPANADRVLETWSTLCVRHETQSAVDRARTSNTDYFEMQVKFDRHQQLFSSLHEVAHWVVTLDSFIGRDQIDALDNRPDVILVKPAVGKNEAYTLIVSSESGRKLVVQRLRRRLLEIGVVAEREAEDVARRLYDVGRNVAPGAVLRSLGIGTTVNEIVGLVATRFALSQRFPVPHDHSGIEAWISFDEHQHWFGRGDRADLGRFVLTVCDDRTVDMQILVAESKFRQDYDLGSAKAQLDRTTDLCAAAFRSGDDAPDDRTFWLQELAAAIEQTSHRVIRAADLPARRRLGPDFSQVDELILGALRSGQVRLTEVRGVAVAIASAQETPAPGLAALGAHDLLRLHKPELQRLISLLIAEADPSGSASSDPIVGIPNDVGSSGIAEPIPVVAPFTLAHGVGDATAASDPVEPGAGGHLPADAPESLGIGDDTLRRRYEVVLDVLGQHGVRVREPESDAWDEGPGFYVLRVVPQPGVTLDKVTSRIPEISLALKLPGEYNIRWRRDGGSILFEVPKIGDEKYPVHAAGLWDELPIDMGRLIAPIGRDISGGLVSIDFSSADSPHLLVAGTTGSGKSVALETMLRGLTRYDQRSLRLRLVDPKGTELVDFERAPHLDGQIGTFPEDAIEILEKCVEEMEGRYRAMRDVRARKLVEYNEKVSESDRWPWIVVVLDEYADLTSDPDDKKRIEELLRRLTQKARAAGIHVIAATQRPSADVISTTIRSNFPAQLALRVKSSTDSRIILDENGAESLAGQGDALLRTAQGLRRLQVALA
ncbi:FtsK/SpoIIIE domain-containing protein [Promicromonospora sp. NPDC023805]|uniref:FtsK/SpoIIIE domain-containing protein n=1 Tax=Promicromonospora sp. NPDC023805 TaxID=3154696 RepID=UPI0033C41E32